MMSYSKSTLHTLPTDPGVYSFSNSDDEIIYVGKAKNLKNRVRSYFSSKQHDLKTMIMVSQIDRIDVITTRTEKEALLLENQRIKTLKPRYNIALRDDKTYPYIKVTTHEPFPQLIITRNKINDNARYFGPYPSYGSTRSLRKLLFELFPIRQCKQKLTLNEVQPKCILLDIEKCIGPCIYKESKKEHDTLLDQLTELLSGKNKAVLRQLKKEMQGFSDSLEFEKAAQRRDAILQLEKLLEKQQVALGSADSFQIWVQIHNKKQDYVLVQDILEGKLLYQKGYYQDYQDEKDSQIFFEQCLLDYISESKRIPDYILCDKNHHKLCCSTLSQKDDYCIHPQKGEKKQLLSVATIHARQALDRIQLNTLKNSHNAGELLKKDLGLKKIPQTILGFDISHLQGQDIVASSVCFTGGSPNKEQYRHYKINTVAIRSNDPASIREVVTRRLKDCLKTQFIPDLLVIDGGQAQLNYAYAALHSLGCEHIDCISLAKKEEEIYRVGEKETLRLPRQHQGLKLLQYIRDESHRFALRLQRKQRNKKGVMSILSNIQGMGVKRINTLYQTFGSLENLAQETPESITKKTRFPLSLSENIKKLLS